FAPSARRLALGSLGAGESRLPDRTTEPVRDGLQHWRRDGLLTVQILVGPPGGRGLERWLSLAKRLTATCCLPPWQRAVAAGGAFSFGHRLQIKIAAKHQGRSGPARRTMPVHLLLSPHRQHVNGCAARRASAPVSCLPVRQWNGPILAMLSKLLSAALN